jgi:hypothetical protein
MNRFEITGDGPRKRLKSDVKLTAEDFDAIAKALGTKPQRARKVGLVSACVVREATTVDTVWSGERTRSQAGPGDWIVTNLDRYGNPLRDDKGELNQYVIKAERFPELYKRIPGETEQGPRFQAREESKVDSVRFSGGIDILAPWDRRQAVESGYLLRNGNEVYANDEESFEKTYELSREPSQRS